MHQLYNLYKESELSGRYITSKMIAPLIENLASKFEVKHLGNSVEGKPIHSIKAGDGQIKVLLWSQMHGNESTTTKAIFDLINCFAADTQEIHLILESCTLMIVPMLNPDGAHKYTRVNANGIDLNRDAQNLSQPESRILRDLFEAFKPHYCFNLHGQRTIFGAGNSGTPATLSFLAPAMDEEKSLPDHRKKAMSIITNLYKKLNPKLNGGIGLYDDGFNINCVGDTFQNHGASTILFEAGHHPNDYDREITRQFIFEALISALDYIAKGVKVNDYERYFDIPKNETCFYDVIIRNARLSEMDKLSIDIAIQFKEVLNDDFIAFVPEISKIEDLPNYFGHKEIDAKYGIVKNSKNETIKVGNEIDFAMLNNRKILIKS